MAKKSEKGVRLTLAFEFKSTDPQERYLARILREGLYIDDKKITKLSGLNLAKHLILHSASNLDADFMKEVEIEGQKAEDAATDIHRVGATKSAGKKTTAKDQEEKISSLGLKGILS